VFLTLLLSYRSEALLQLPEDWVFPFGFFIAFPSGISGNNRWPTVFISEVLPIV
jgi:hypothetical protein